MVRSLAPLGMTTQEARPPYPNNPRFTLLKSSFVSFVDFVRGRLVLLFLKHFDRVPSFVRRLLLVLEGAFEVGLGQKIVRIKFEEA